MWERYYNCVLFRVKFKIMKLFLIFNLIILGWIGFNQNVMVKAEISTILKGYGSATLEFGNCVSEGTVKVFLNDKEIGSIAEKGRKKIGFEFWHGDTLMFRGENNGMILFSHFEYICKGIIFM